MGEWIGQIVPASQATEDKLTQKHNLTIAQIMEAVAHGAHERAFWHDHPTYGRMLIVYGSDSISGMVVYLRPIDREDGLWECLTAWREQ
jgi:hypothetical protein